MKILQPVVICTVIFVTKPKHNIDGVLFAVFFHLINDFLFFFFFFIYHPLNTMQRRMAATPNTKDGSSVRTTAKTAAVQPVKTKHSSTRLEVKS